MIAASDALTAVFVIVFDLVFVLALIWGITKFVLWVVHRSQRKQNKEYPKYHPEWYK